MKKLRFILIAAALPLLALSCNKHDGPNYAPSAPLKAIVVNEICPAVADGDDGWVELLNTSSSAVDIYGLQLLITDDYYDHFDVFKAPDISLAAGERLVVSSSDMKKNLVINVNNLELVTLASGTDSVLYEIDVKALASKAGKPVAGGSWSRFPDASGDFVVTEKATQGGKNYKFVPYKIGGLLINEICPSAGWVELYSSTGLLNLYETTLVKTDWSGVDHVVYTFGENASIKRWEYVSVDADLGDLKALKLVSNEGIVADSFSVSDVRDSGNPSASQSYSRLPNATGDWYISQTVTKNAVNQDSATDLSGLVINEVCLSGGWIEVLNPTVRTLRTSGAAVKVGGVQSGTLPATLAPGGRAVVDASVAETSEIALVATDGNTVLDSFNAGSVKDGMAPETGGSWSRIPDNGPWYTVKTASKNTGNYGIIKGNTVGIWYNQSNTPSLQSNLDQFVKLGIGHVFLHEYAFRYYESLIPDILAKAKKLGITIHIWMQCFWWNDNQGVNGWRSPVIDSEKRYDQDMFDDILGESRAAKYVKAGVQGIHFDYIRFGGTAYKHDYTDVGVTGVGAIDEFCRQAAEKLRAINPDLILSAALMAEAGSERYYGQHPESMGQYLDILIPMIYGNSSGKTAGTCKSLANYFANHGTPAQCWAGTDTYSSSGTGLSAADIKSSCLIYKDTNAAGIVLFRHGLGTLPDLLDLKLNGQ